MLQLVVMAATALAAGCASSPQPSTTAPTPTSPTSPAPAATIPMGTSSYRLTIDVTHEACTMISAGHTFELSFDGQLTSSATTKSFVVPHLLLELTGSNVALAGGLLLDGAQSNRWDVSNRGGKGSNTSILTGSPNGGTPSQGVPMTVTASVSGDKITGTFAGGFAAPQGPPYYSGEPPLWCPDVRTFTWSLAPR